MLTWSRSRQVIRNGYATSSRPAKAGRRDCLGCCCRDGRWASLIGVILGHSTTSALGCAQGGGRAGLADVSASVLPRHVRGHGTCRQVRRARFRIRDRRRRAISCASWSWRAEPRRASPSTSTRGKSPTFDADRAVEEFARGLRARGRTCCACSSKCRCAPRSWATVIAGPGARDSGAHRPTASALSRLEFAHMEALSALRRCMQAARADPRAAVRPRPAPRGAAARPTAYQILGGRREASDAEVKKAYRRQLSRASSGQAHGQRSARVHARARQAEDAARSRRLTSAFAPRAACGEYSLGTHGWHSSRLRSCPPISRGSAKRSKRCSPPAPTWSTST